MGRLLLLPMLKHLKLPDCLFKYLGAAILIIVPLYPKFPLISISGTFVAIRFEDLLLAFGGILIAFSCIKKTKSVFQNRVVGSLLMYLMVSGISLLSATLITDTVDFRIGFYHWLRRVEYVIPFFIGMEIISRRVKVSFFLKIFLVVIFIAFVYGYGQKNFNWPIIVTQNQEYSRGVALRYIPGGHINSTFAGHYDLASFLVMVLPIVVVSFFTLKGKISKFALAIVYLLGMWLLVNSASRISLFSYLLAVLASMVMVKRYKEIIPIIIISIVFVGFSTNLIGRYGRLMNIIKERFGYVGSTAGVVYAESQTSIRRTDRPVPTPTPTPRVEDRSTNIRLNIEWPRAVRAFFKNPLLGTGYSSITLATDNDYLRSLGETGILGFASFLLIFINIFTHILNKYPFVGTQSGVNLALLAGFTGGMVGISVNAIFIDVFEASKFAIIFWFLAGLVVKVCEKNYEKGVENIH